MLWSGEALRSKLRVGVRNGKSRQYLHDGEPKTSYTRGGNALRRSLCEQVGGHLRCSDFLLLPEGEISA